MPQDVTILICNCSICRRSSYQHLIVPEADFTLLAGDDALSDYRFGTQTAVHRFCARCGVKAFYSPRSHPGSYSVNLKCVDQGTIASTKIEYFDGANWEQAAKALGT